ncbi:outer membrane protein assembly factor BamD [Rhodothermus profundi]|uniref:Beta-barrel assembly machine subunit BamD n=1 Tax=Rhodothermus profundi TaxID=633813 RepID=A0A1M6TCE5_9BACT|nr:outer membrane protein assembly factor BamD [Rhodothermus profundi]SHK54613.1 Beta-barrel assembly machine subunit BamD [Rhodothermus profundi]
MRQRTQQIVGRGLLVVGLLVAGCAGSGRLQHSSPQEAFERAMAFYNQGKYDRAIAYFKAVFTYGSMHEWAADAQFYLARAYYHNKEYLLAASEYERFIQIYQIDPRVPEAEYERAMCYYKLSPPYELDQTDTRKAIEAFQLFIDRYPNHELVDDATQKIRELRAKLARKQYEAGRLYERRELYEAAAVTYEAVFDTYPDTPWADDALLGAMRAYAAYARQSIRARQPERYRKVIELYERMLQIFPDSPLLRTAEALYAQARQQLEKLEANTSLARGQLQN